MLVQHLSHPELESKAGQETTSAMENSTPDQGWTCSFVAQKNNKAKEEFPVSLWAKLQTWCELRWDVAVEGPDGKIAPALPGILFFDCAKGAVWWQRITAV